MYRRSLEGWSKHWDFILLDTICLQIAYIIAYAYRFGFNRFAYNGKAYREIGILLCVIGLFVAMFFNTMKQVLRRGVLAEFRMTLFQSAMVFAGAVVCLFSTKEAENVSRVVLYVTVGIYTFISFAIRLLYKYFLNNYMFLGKRRNMLLVSDKEMAERMINRLNSHPEECININGLVLVDGDGSETGVGDIKVVSDIAGAPDYIMTQWIDEVYIAVGDHDHIPEDFISECEEMAVTIHQRLILKDEARGYQLIERIAKEPVITNSINIARTWELFIKRFIDIIAGFFMSLSALLVMLVVGARIKKESPGPLLLKHERIGQNGKKFKMYTLRIMYLDADKRLSEWKEKHGDELMGLSKDPRIIGNKEINGEYKTGIGVFIRKSSLQVLPKGFNVLLGQMSLVGTRAPSVREWEEYEHRHRARLACKPGITGLWQASGGISDMSFEEATELDTEYITNWTLGLDWKIVFKVLFGRH